MIEIDKVQRDQITTILQGLNIDNVDKKSLAQMMRVIGFEDDVVFAKSLFSDKIASIYRQNQGEYQKFLALEKVSQLPYTAKCLLFAVFRRYSQSKIKQQCQKGPQKNSGVDISSLNMPDSNDIGQIIKFQKKMYETLKHLIPKKQPEINPFFSLPPRSQIQSQSELATFRFNPFCAQNSFRNFDQQYLSSIQSPLLPQFNNRSFLAPPTYELQNKSAQFFSFRSEPFPHNDQLFNKLGYVDTKKRIESFAQLQSKNSSSLYGQKSFVKQQQPSPRGFTVYAYSEINSGPTKKVKRDSFVPVYTPENIRRVNQQIEVYKRSLQKSGQKKLKAQKDCAISELNIKHSISEYIADDRPHPSPKGQSKQ